MARIPLWPSIALFCEFLAFCLAIGAVAKRSKAHADSSEPGYFSCSYSKDVSSGLAAAAIAFLFIGHIIVTVITKCFCCDRKVTYKRGCGRVCAILLYIFSWLTFLIAEATLLQAAIVNNIRTKRLFDTGVYTEDEIHCRTARKAVFATGTAFTFLTMLLSIVYYFLQKRAENKESTLNTYRGDQELYADQSAPTVGMTAYN